MLFPRPNAGQQRLQPGLDLRTARLEERWQGQLLPEVRGVFVGGEAGAIGRDLEEDAAEFAEVQRLELEAVDHRCDAESGGGDPLLPRLMLLIVGGAE